MKFKVAQDTFASALKRCTLGGGNPTNPVHTVVRVEALKGDTKDDSDSLILTAHNGLTSIEIMLAADCQETGVVATQTRTLATAAQVMPLGELAVATDGTKLRMLGKPGRRWSGATVDAEAMGLKRSREPVDAEWLRVPLDALKRAISSVEHVTRTVEAHQPATDGIYFEATGNTLCSVALTNHLMAARTQSALELGLDGKPPWKGLVPTRMLPLINDAIAEAEKAKDDGVDFYLDADFIYVSGSSTLVYCVNSRVDFPPWRAVAETYRNDPVICTLPRLAVIETLKALQATASTDVTARISLGEGRISFSGITDNVDFEDEIPVSSLQPNVSALFGVKSGYLYDCMRACGEDPQLSLAGDGYMYLRTTDGYEQMMCPRDLSKSPLPEEKKKEKKS